MRFFSCLISFVSRCIAAACIESVGLYIANVLTFKFESVCLLLDAVGLYIANVLTFKRITTMSDAERVDVSWTLYCKCTNFQANHNLSVRRLQIHSVGLYIANVLTFKRITTPVQTRCKAYMLDSILQMY